jgi:tetratricopeptide (TPR) repeat protein
MRDSYIDYSQTAEFVSNNIVKIVNRDGTKFFGTGFCLFKNQQKFIITCHHCICYLDQIFIEKDEIQYPCKWIEEFSDMTQDLAVLTCDNENIPVEPLNYNPKALPKLDVIMWGFATDENENLPTGRSIEDLRLASDYNYYRWKAEEIIGGNNKWNNKPEVNLNVFQIRGVFEKGFSGAPVCYTGDNNVIGIFTAKTDNNGYLIPIQTLLNKFNKNSEILTAQSTIDTKEYLEKGNLFYDKRKFNEAIIQYDEIIKDVNYLSALSNKGRSLAQLRENKKALEIFNLVLEIKPDFVYALLGMGAIFYNQGKYQEVIDWCDKVLEIDPNNVVSLNNKGLALSKQGKYPEAIEYFDKALAIDPTCILTINTKGLTLSEQGKYPEAIEYFDKALAIDSTYIYTINTKGYVLSKQGKYPEAIEYFDKALVIDPNFIDAMNNKGIALYEQGKYQDAIEYYDKALAIDPNDSIAMNNKCLALLQQGNNPNIFDPNKIFDIDYILATNTEDTALYRQSKYQEAIECVDKALEIDPNSIHAMNTKGQILSEQRKYQDAIDWCDKALAIDSTYIYAMNTKGIALSKQGKNQEALACFNKVLEIEPTFVLAQDNKKILLERLSMLERLSNLERLSKDKTNSKNYSSDNA